MRSIRVSLRIGCARSPSVWKSRPEASRYTTYACVHGIGQLITAKSQTTINRVTARTERRVYCETKRRVV